MHNYHHCDSIVLTSFAQCHFQAKSQFKQRSTANNVEILIPVPADADSPEFKASAGSVKYRPEKSAVVWSMKQFPGGKEVILQAHFNLPSITSGESQASHRLLTCVLII